MAVPKQRMGRIRTHQRRSMHDRIDAPSRSVCPQCGEKPSHLGGLSCNSGKREACRGAESYDFG